MNHPVTRQQRALYRARRYLERVTMILDDRPYPDDSIIGYLLLAAGELWIGADKDPQIFTKEIKPVFRMVKENVLLLPVEKNQPADLRIQPGDLNDAHATTKSRSKTAGRTVHNSETYYPVPSLADRPATPSPPGSLPPHPPPSLPPLPPGT